MPGDDGCDKCEGEIFSGAPILHSCDEWLSSCSCFSMSDKNEVRDADGESACKLSQASDGKLGVDVAISISAQGGQVCQE